MEPSSLAESAFAAWLQRRESGASEAFEELLARHPDEDGHLRELHQAWRILSDVQAHGAAAPPAGVAPETACIGRYRRLQLLGRGGQGEVWLAEDSRLRRKVALKLLRRNDPERLRRLEREAGITSRLDHPGICQVYEWGEEAGQYYIAMRHIDGRSLARILLDRTPPTRKPSRSGRKSGSSSGIADERREIRRFVRMAAAVARTLHAAHEAGVVHRDVKPANILVSKEDEPILVDFGFAQDSEGDWSELTHSTDLLGTPVYMSPEQARGMRQGQLDRRTDVWSLGATLYECLCGRRAFDGPNWQTVFQDILTREPDSARKCNAAIDSDLAVVLARALEKDRDRRYATALALAEDLEACLAGRPIAARPVSLAGRLRRWARREPVLAALAGALAAALPALGALTSYAVLTRKDVQAAEANALERRLEQRLLDGFARLSQIQWQPALADFEWVLHERPGSLEAAFGKFWSLFQLDREQAVAYLREGLPPLEPGGFAAAFRDAYLAGGFEGASATEVLPELPEAATAGEHLIAAWSWIRIWEMSGTTTYSGMPVHDPGSLSSAREHLEAAILLSPSPRLLYLHLLSEVLLRQKASPMLLEALRSTMLARWPESDWGQRSVAEAFLYLRPERTLAIIEDLDRRGFDVSDMQLTLGIAQAATKDHLSAQRTMRELIARDAGNASAHYNLGVSMIALHDFEGARSENAEAVRLRPDLSTAWSNLGLANLRLGLLDEGLAASREALRLDPGQLYALFQIVAGLRLQGDLEAALAQARTILPLASDPAFPIDAGAVLSELSELERDSALVEAWWSAAAEPPSAEERARLAWSMLRCGRAEDAASLYADLLIETPDSFEDPPGELALRAAAALARATLESGGGADSPWAAALLELLPLARAALAPTASENACQPCELYDREAEYAILREQRWWASFDEPTRAELALLRALASPGRIDPRGQK